MNALEELNSVLGPHKLIAAKLSYGNPSTEERKTMNAILYPDHTTEEYAALCEMLDFEYYEGYGSQELYGTLWLEDGSWATRAEYDGCEWWEFHDKPELPVRPEYMEGK